MQARLNTFISAHDEPRIPARHLKKQKINPLYFREHPNDLTREMEEELNKQSAFSNSLESLIQEAKEKVSVNATVDEKIQQARKPYVR